MAIKSFKDFINEEVDQVRHKKVKHIEDCKCEEDDPWSTQNYHRVPKGEEEQAKPKKKKKK